MLPPSNRGLTAQIEAELLIFYGTGLLRFSLTKPFSPAARKAVKRYSCHVEPLLSLPRFQVRRGGRSRPIATAAPAASSGPR